MTYSKLSLLRLIDEQRPSMARRLLIAMTDWALGINKMNALYQQHAMQGMSKERFADTLIKILDIKVEGLDELINRIPKTGPVVIASNHPFGGIEGVILARALSTVRPDLKVLANQGLKLFPELQDYFIFTNPLSAKDPRNAPSIRQCKRHVQEGGALLIFPAGKVSYRDRKSQRLREHTWNRIVANLGKSDQCQYVPLFVSGENSALFYSVERIYHKLRMFLLGHELLNKHGAEVSIAAGFPVGAKHISSAEQCRLLSYAQQPDWRMQWPPNRYTELQPLAAPTDPNAMVMELASLPDKQHLVEYKQYDIYYGYQSQMPNVVTEIARLRESVFRELNEGSGEPIDTDYFDSTYTHLFVFDREEKAIVGAYRMGQTDRLLANGDLSQLYLSRMFDFTPDFVNQQTPCLEMGRSFLIPRMQRSHVGLYLLWRGIGAFVSQFPQYRTLYGTVSISKMYDTRSVKLIEQAYVTPTQAVKPKTAFLMADNAEIVDSTTQQSLIDYLPALLQSIEPDGKSIPILMKHYLRLGATFHCLGIDANFNDTPGFLLSVDLPRAPEKQLQLYIGDEWQAYRDYSPLADM
ncbi:lysophospholipid acyltransferase family protein [Alteromonas facilis]|uniref:lysophospholipid acyltransferase family protein n=1 Tax=Alteromonas facilis TaxID=2048004 RepID=UPI000C28FA07|nr:lysophospholipid acyltransferase family protein [Alteromonas facilis]